MKTYTVADLRKNTRQILNEAADEPVLVTRYDETFVLSKFTGSVQASEPKLINKPEDVKGVASPPGACVHGAAPGFCKVAKCPNAKRS